MSNLDSSGMLIAPPWGQPSSQTFTTVIATDLGQIASYPPPNLTPENVRGLI